MLWFAIPLAIGGVIGAKKLYDAISDDDFSSSSSTTYSDNSAQRERERRREVERQNQQRRKERLIAQMRSTTQASLNEISHRYLVYKLTFKYNYKDGLSEFFNANISTVSQAQSALAHLSTNLVKLKADEDIKELKALREKVDALTQLEQLLKEL